jgi:hypothetical protein
MKLNIRPLIIAYDWPWINDQVGILRVEDSAGFVGVDENDNRVIACVLDNFTANSVQAHFICVNKMALRRGFLETCYDIIFNELDVKYIYGLVPADREKALKLNAHMGFTEKTRLIEAFKAGVDYVLMELKKENCKYIDHKKEVA